MCVLLCLLYFTKLCFMLYQIVLHALSDRASCFIKVLLHALPSCAPHSTKSCFMLYQVVLLALPSCASYFTKLHFRELFVYGCMKLRRNLLSIHTNLKRSTHQYVLHTLPTRASCFTTLCVMLYQVVLHALPSCASCSSITCID